MARKNKDVEEELDLDLDDLDLDEDDDMEDLVEEEDAPEEEAKPKKKPKKKAEPDNTIGANQLAKQLGTEGYKFRAWLRKQYPEHKKGTSWKWEKDSKELQEVIDTYKAKDNKPKRKDKSAIEVE
jgi:phage antirepressor YoqD-like protein